MTHRQMAPAAAQQMVLSHGAARHPAPRYVLTRAVGTGERIAPNSSAKQSMNQLDALKLVRHPFSNATLLIDVLVSIAICVVTTNP